MFDHFFRKDIAVDLGSATTRIFIKDRGVVCRQPTLIALDSQTGEMLAAGDQALALLADASGNVKIFRPIRNGVICDVELTKRMLKWFFKQSLGFCPRCRIFVCLRQGLTPLQLQAHTQAIEQSMPYATLVTIEQPLAGALGAGLHIHGARTHFIADLGAGCTNTGIITCASISTGEGLDTGGDSLDGAIKHFVREQHGILIGARSAQRLKINLANACKPFVGRMEIRGREIYSGLPLSRTVTGEEIFHAIQPPLQLIMQSMLRTLEQAPPELAGELIRAGITLTGGGALLCGLDQRIAQETGLATVVASAPTECAISGLERAYLQLVKVDDRQITA